MTVWNIVIYVGLIVQLSNAAPEVNVNNLTITEIGADEIHFSWSSDVPDDDVVYYRYRSWYAEGDTVDDGSITDANIPTTQHQTRAFENLMPATTYAFFFTILRVASNGSVDPVTATPVNIRLNTLSATCAYAYEKQYGSLTVVIGVVAGVGSVLLIFLAIFFIRKTRICERKKLEGEGVWDGAWNTPAPVLGEDNAGIEMKDDGQPSGGQYEALEGARQDYQNMGGENPYKELSYED